MLFSGKKSSSGVVELCCASLYNNWKVSQVCLLCYIQNHTTVEGDLGVHKVLLSVFTPYTHNNMHVTYIQNHTTVEGDLGMHEYYIQCSRANRTPRNNLRIGQHPL